MSNFPTDKAAGIAKAMKPRDMHVNQRKGHYKIVPYQTTHNTGGAIMGTDPRSSVVNRFLQSWDVPNLFVVGSCTFPQNAGYNPTGTVGARISTRSPFTSRICRRTKRQRTRIARLPRMAATRTTTGWPGAAVLARRVGQPRRSHR